MVDGLKEEANGFGNGLFPDLGGCSGLGAGRRETLPTEDCGSADGVGAKGLTGGGLAVEAKPDTNGDFWRGACCEPEALIEAVPLIAVPKRIQTSEPVV
jgi:hypothetical protein